MLRLTKPQQRSLVRKWQEDDQGLTFLAFRRTAAHLFGDDCVMVEWSGLLLGIEADGCLIYAMSLTNLNLLSVARLHLPLDRAAP